MPASIQDLLRTSTALRRFNNLTDSPACNSRSSSGIGSASARAARRDNKHGLTLVGPGSPAPPRHSDASDFFPSRVRHRQPFLRRKMITTTCKNISNFFQNFPLTVRRHSRSISHSWFDNVHRLGIEKRRDVGRHSVNQPLTRLDSFPTNMRG